MMMQVNELLDTVASKEEIKEVLTTILTFLKEKQATFEQNVNTNKEELSTQVQAFRGEIDGLITELEGKIADFNVQNGQSVEAAKNEIRAELADALSILRGELPEETDLSELYILLTEQRDRMNALSDLQTAENIRNALEVLKGEERLDAAAIKGLEEMLKSMMRNVDKRIVAAVGSISVPSPVGWTKHQSIDLSSGTTVYSLDEAPAHNGKAAIVRYEGQVLTETTHYSFDGTDITLTFDPDNSTKLDVTYWPF